MTTSTPNATSPLPQGGEPVARSGPPRGVWIAVGICALAGVGAASTLVWKKDTARLAEVDTPAAVAAAQALPGRDKAAAADLDDPAAPVRGEPPTPVPEKAATVRREAAERPAPAKPRNVAAAPCAQCGVVESVQAVQKKGEATGVGAVAGTVIGGVIGNQFGGGDGKKAMTVIGAVGGGVAGHEVEKRARGTTVYKVTVRLDNGQVRQLEQAQAPAVGARVRIDGGTLRRLNSAG